jgi:hypothetical protein
MTGQAPIFQQLTPLALYALSTYADTGLNSFWAGYRPSVHASFQGTASLEQVWQDVGGVYLFLNQRPADATAFAAFLNQLDILLKGLSPAGEVRFLWIANPTDAVGNWQIRALHATATGSGNAVAWQVARAAQFVLGEYAVAIAAGAALGQANPVTLGYGITVDAAGFTLVAPGDGYGALAGSAWLPLAGTSLGGWRAQLSLPANPSGQPSGQPSVDHLQRLRVLVRYAAPLGDSTPGDQVATLDLAVLRQGTAAVPLYLAYDPLNPLLASRSRLSFFADDGSGAAPTFDGTFRTSRGYATRFTPKSIAAPLRAARLVFCHSPLFMTDDPAAASWTYHLAPDGAFDVTVVVPANASAGTTTTDKHRLIFGLSGLEYAALPPGLGAIGFFQASQPAFATGGAAGDAALALTDFATTAYATFLPTSSGAGGLLYYAQPQQAPLFAGSGTLGSGILDFLEVQAAVLPSWTAGAGGPPAALPAAPFAGADSADAALARRIEYGALAPARRAALGLPPPGQTLGAANTLAVTPQGLLLEVGTTKFERVVIANMPNSSAPQIAFNRIGPAFQAALQANQLFIVVSNVQTFLASAGVQPPFAAEFDGWHFALSPSGWRADPNDHPTVMLLKYCNRSLVDLVVDTPSWGWPEAAQDAHGSVQPTQRLIRDVIKAARARAEDQHAAPNDPYTLFYREVAANPLWNGVLFLNVPVDFAKMPQELQFLAAGVNPAEFFAHHVGFSLTPFDSTTNPITLGQTAAFGLIDYQDPQDLVASTSVPFAFKTLSLRIRFANAHIADFSAQVELMVNQLFGASLIKQDPSHGNNLVLDGSYQQVGGLASYAFVLSGQNIYAAARSALAIVEVLGVRLNTTSGAGAGLLAANFVLSGNLRFYAPDEFDLLCYGPDPGPPPADGYLRFDNLTVTMAFPLATPGQQTFTLGETGLSFDLANSQARDISLVSNFPVVLSGFIASPNLAAPDKPPEGQAPEDMGYTSVAAPFSQTPMTPPWYGLVYALDLGTLGALAGSVGLKVQLLAAWSIGSSDDDLPLYLGLKLSNTSATGGSLPLQGVMRLGFRSFQFSTYQQDGKRAYLLRLRRFALSVLLWSFPPGNLDLFLFGGPSGRSTGALSWLAAYDQGEQQQEQGARMLQGAVLRPPRRLPKSLRTARRLRSGRRIPPVGRHS